MREVEKSVQESHEAASEMRLRMLGGGQSDLVGKLRGEERGSRRKNEAKSESVFPPPTKREGSLRTHNSAQASLGGGNFSRRAPLLTVKNWGAFPTK